MVYSHHIRISILYHNKTSHKLSHHATKHVIHAVSGVVLTSLAMSLLALSFLGAQLQTFPCLIKDVCKILILIVECWCPNQHAYKILVVCPRYLISYLVTSSDPTDNRTLINPYKATLDNLLN